jgi:predicted RNA-binding Zn-ribbon protein involved in translation (DUF1610 family)
MAEEFPGTSEETLLRALERHCVKVAAGLFRANGIPEPARLRRFETHTPGMTRGAQSTVVFACPNCGAIYQAAQHRVPDRCFGVFNCLACHAQVYAWHGAYDFLDWKVGFLAGDAHKPD